MKFAKPPIELTTLCWSPGEATVESGDRATFLSPLLVPLWTVVVGSISIAGYCNAANFMDGLNGMSGFHGIFGGVFYCIIGWMSDTHWLQVSGAVTAASFAVFLPWNFLRPGTFLGDSGSYLLGAALAVAAYGAILSGIHFVVAIGPMIIYLVDTSYTLVRRMASGESWYRSHKSHIYQRVQQLGLSHLSCSLIVAAYSALTAVTSLGFATSNELIEYLTIGMLMLLTAAYLRTPNIVQKTLGGFDRVGNH